MQRIADGDEAIETESCENERGEDFPGGFQGPVDCTQNWANNPVTNKYLDYGQGHRERNYEVNETQREYVEESVVFRSEESLSKSAHDGEDAGNSNDSYQEEEEVNTGDR